MVFKFGLTDGQMVAQLPSILEGGEAQTAQATAAEQPRPPRGTNWPDRETAAEKAASRYLLFKFRLTDGQMVAQLQSILEGGEAQTAQPTAAEQSSPRTAPARPRAGRSGRVGGLRRRKLRPGIWCSSSA